MGDKGKILIIIDGNSVIHRAFHALPVLTTKKGETVNAIYGFLLVFLKAIKDFQPDFIAACFDLPGPTFRHKKFKEYKAKRPPTPEELRQQIPKVKEILEKFNVAVFEKQGFEADDIIGTIAVSASAKQSLPETESIILSGDLDCLQLVDDWTQAYILRKGVKDIILYNQERVKEKFQGLIPEQLIDFKALRGDPSDNIPGVAGIGEKTAINLLLEFGTLENLYREAEENSEKTKKIKLKLKEILLKQKERAFLSKELATIKKDVAIDFSLEKCQWQGYDKEKTIQALKKFEFYSLMGKLPDFNGQKKLNREGFGENLKLW